MTPEAIPLRPKREAAPPPDGLSEEMARMWREVLAVHVLGADQIRKLERACECFDMASEAKKVLDAEGVTYEDRFGQPKPRPEEQVWRQNTTLFARLMRELNLDPPPEESRPPRLY